ncbi:4-hydroxybenzoate polyprenyltransferase [Thermoplasmatales archaeon ex4572_165]|nr:MAG: 4-hydroxybenzoate polyprenyltransferase [Thermoplasmatales archaeon ex4572_165]
MSLSTQEQDHHIGKLTMKEPYVQKRFLSAHIRGYVDLFRPFTLLAPFIVSMSIIVASLVYNNVAVSANWWVTVGNASLTVAMVNAASNALNQATDVEGDKISKPYRPIPRGIIKPDEAQSLAYVLYLFALLRAVTINQWFGFFIFLIMVFTVLYSLPPKTKKFLFFNQVWIAIPRGLFGILASWSVFGNPMQPLPLLMGLLATIYLIGGMTTKDIVDENADRLMGIRTLVNVFGLRKAAIISFPFLIIPFIGLPILINYGYIESYLWPITGLMIGSLIVFYLMFTGDTESETLENIHAWSFMYVVYIFYALGFSLLTIFHDPIQKFLSF